MRKNIILLSVFWFFLPLTAFAAPFYYFDTEGGTVEGGPYDSYSECQSAKPITQYESYSNCLDIGGYSAGEGSYFYYYNGMIIGGYDSYADCQADGGSRCFFAEGIESDSGTYSGSDAGSDTDYQYSSESDRGVGSSGSSSTTGDCDEGYEKMAGVCVPYSETVGGLSDREPGQVVVSVMNWLMAILGLIAIIMFVVAGMLYLTAAGDEQKTETAKRIIMYTIVGVAVALTAYVIVMTVEQLVTGGEGELDPY